MLRRLLDGWPLVIVLVFIVAVSGPSDASRRPCRNYRYGDHLKAYFDPRNCRDLDDVRWECNKVVFNPDVLKTK